MNNRNHTAARSNDSNTITATNRGNHCNTLALTDCNALKVTNNENCNNALTVNNNAINATGSVVVLAPELGGNSFNRAGRFGSGAARSGRASFNDESSDDESSDDGSEFDFYGVERDWCDDSPPLGKRRYRCYWYMDQDFNEDWVLDNESPPKRRKIGETLKRKNDEDEERPNKRARKH